MTSVLVKKQEKVLQVTGEGCVLLNNYGYKDVKPTSYFKIRYDDCCNNGHNSFAITGTIYDKDSRRGDCTAFGCLHTEFALVFPEYKHLLKWHHMNSIGPMHYIDNTLYHVRNGNLDYARGSAIWPDATDAQLALSPLKIKALLLARLPKLIEEFKSDVEALGFTF